MVDNNESNRRKKDCCTTSLWNKNGIEEISLQERICMSPIIMFAISFVASFLGSFIAVVITLYLHKKQIEELRKLKKSLQGTVRRLKKELNKK